MEQNTKLDKAMLLYAVTDRAWTKNQTLYEQAKLALKGGATCLQIREKHLGDKDFLDEALQFKDLCKEYGVPLIINDNIDVAIKCGADGVHIGQHDINAKTAKKLIGKNMILGVSAQTPAQAIQAQNDGADYIGAGAVFATSTKPDADFVSRETLKQICQSITIPVVAIGGICKENIMELKGTGIKGIALVSAIFAADDIENECRELLNLSTEMIKA